jgi:hypothetical protein
VALPAAVHDVPRNFDAPGKSLRVMDWKKGAKKGAGRSLVRFLGMIFLEKGGRP